MGNFIILLKKNLIEMLRNKKLIIAMVVFACISFISSLSARFLPELFNVLLEELEGELGASFMFESTVADSYVQYISNIGQIGILLVVLIFATSISKEKSSGTYSVLSMNKVKDRDIVLAHFVSQLILITISFLLSISVFVVLNIILFKQIMGVRGIVTLGYLYLLLIITSCFTLLCSALVKKKNNAYLFVILGYFILSILESIPKINWLNPLHLLSISSDLMYYKEYLLSEHLTTFISSLIMGVGLLFLVIYICKNKVNNRKMGVNND